MAMASGYQRGCCGCATLSFCSTLLTMLMLLLTAVCVHESEASGRMKRALLFPPGNSMGVFLAIAVPVDLPNYELAFSYNFEANYLLPSNATELELGPNFIGTDVRYARSLTRTRVYGVLEDHLESEGLVGKECILRAICETASTSILGHNGLLGDLIHLIFTPSTSENEGLPKEFEEAETLGNADPETCRSKYTECPVNLYDMFSIFENNLFNYKNL